MVAINCNFAGINQFVPNVDNPWDKKRILHLHNRIGYGTNNLEIQNALGQNPMTYIDSLVDAAINGPIPADPYYANWTIDDYYNTGEERYEHLDQLSIETITDKLVNGFKSKMALFWHNHFVTIFETYEAPPYLWAYYKIILQYSFGNFKDFLKEIGKCGAMLCFLNGNTNEGSDPNENYARELFELFALGENNGYTENDILNAARSLTGWRANGWEILNVHFDSNYYDAGTKTIFGQTGNFNYDQLHDLIFTERANECATFICTKLYQHFVYNEPSQTIVNELVNTFLNSDFEIEPVVRQILKSEHFFDQSIIGAQVKSPLEYFISIFKLSNAGPDDLQDWVIGGIRWNSYELGQRIFSPVDVAGWQGYRSWINESTFTNRKDIATGYVYSFNEDLRDKILQMAVDLTNNSDDPYVITNAFINQYLSFELTGSQYEAAVATFKGDVPENYYTDGIWTLNYQGSEWQCLALINFLVNLPEFQLY